MKPVPEPYRYRDTDAARMLQDALRRCRQERGLSMREIARRLEYKQPTVLSHMANGHARVPLRRAQQIAEIVGLPLEPFMEAVLKQHDLASREHAFSLAAGPFQLTDFASELAQIAGESLDRLSEAHKQVLREVVTDTRPDRRWLSAAELPVVEAIRQVRPRFRTEGLDAVDRHAIQKGLTRT